MEKRYVFIPFFLSCSTYQVGSVRLRDDVGIVPYIRVKPCTVQRTFYQASIVHSQTFQKMPTPWWPRVVSVEIPLMPLSAT